MYLSAPRRGRRRRRALLRRLRDERGYTLIELLVATLAGTIVTGAMAAIVIVSVHFSSNYNDRVDANQEGRLAMQRITQALNSSCVSSGVTPIQSGSDQSHLIFYSSLTDSVPIAPNEVEVQLSGGSLQMLTYANTGGSGTTSSPWTFSSTASPSVTLLQYANNSTSGGATVPVFQYYGYNSSGQLTTNLTPASGSTLSAANAALVAEVVITFQALPSDNWNATGRASDVTSSVVLRLTPASGTTTTSSPCV